MLLWPEALKMQAFRTAGFCVKGLGGSAVSPGCSANHERKRDGKRQEEENDKSEKENAKKTEEECREAKGARKREGRQE